MDQEYDWIVLGTGLKECILSGLLSVSGKTVLHMDRNNYYGGESASLNLEQLYKKFKGVEEKEIPQSMGRTRDYNVDLCPKFIMACGNLVKVLLHTKVTRYLEFKSVQGSYVMKDDAIWKVPSTASEALSTGLMGMFQKRKFKNYLTWVQNYVQEDPKTHETLDVTKVTNKQVFDYWGLDENTTAFVGHAMALYLDDSYLSDKAKECSDRVRLYAYSVTRYGNSPYIYPLWGLGGLPEGFSRLSAIHGGTYMLNRPIEEILFDESGKVCGVKSQGETARCKRLLADPSYFVGGPLAHLVRKTGQVARLITILDHPIGNTDNADSCQIIIPSRQVRGRRSDIYVSCTSYQHNVAAKGMYIAVVQLDVETENPKTEFDPALRLLGKRLVDFFWVSDTYEPTQDGSENNVFITASYDATSHFESATEEVLRLYKAMTGLDVDLTVPADLENPQE